MTVKISKYTNDGKFIDTVELRRQSSIEEYLQAEIEDKYFRNYIKLGILENLTRSNKAKFVNGTKDKRTSYYIVERVS
jgi:hypothetical protein